MLLHIKIKKENEVDNSGKSHCAIVSPAPEASLEDSIDYVVRLGATCCIGKAILVMT